MGGFQLPPPESKKWRWAMLILFAIAFIAWGLRDRWLNTQFQWKAFAASFAALNWPWILASFLVLLATYYGRALRWAVMLRPLRPEARVWSICKATLIGFTAVALLGRPGEFVRPFLIAQREKVPFSSQLAAWLLERIFDMLAVLLIFSFAVSQIRASGATLGPSFRWVLETSGYLVGVLSVICLLVLVMMGRYPGPTRRRVSEALRFLPERHHARIDHTIQAFMDGTASTTRHGSALRLTLYTAFEWSLICLSYFCIFKAYPQTVHLRVQDVLIFTGFVAFGGILQIPGVGGGVQIVSIVVLTRLYGTPFEVATSAAIAVWLITFVGVVPIGLFLAFKEGLNWRKLKELEERAAREGAALEELPPEEAAGGSTP